MPLQWSPDLSVGVEAIDDQHREIFARAGRLVEATRRGGGKDELEMLIGFLEQYVAAHFALEERYMLLYGYPAYRAHVAEHEEFTRDFAGLKEQFAIYGATSRLVIEAERRTAFWLRNHIGRVDRALGHFLKDKLAEQAP